MNKSLSGLLSAAAVSLLLPGITLAAPTVLDTHGRKIVVFDEGVDKEEAAEIISDVGGMSAEEPLADGAATAVVISHESAEALAETHGVARVDDDVELSIMGRLDREQEPSWGVEAVRTRPAWLGSRGETIRVGILDSGIDDDHPDLLGVLRGGTNTISSRDSWDDDNGHGTHVAGIVAARDNSFGTLGIAPNVEIYAIKALNRRGVGYLSDIIQGIDWAIAHDLDVLNMSLGTTQHIPSLEDAVRRATAAGVTIVAAAGNAGGPVAYPAAYDGVIAVGMVDDNFNVHRHSSGGAGLDLVAPGVRITSAYRRGRYKTYTGTSMAAPHVTGAVALLIGTPNDCNRGCPPQSIEERLRSSARDLGSSGWDGRTGAGLLDVARLVGR